MGQKYSAVVVGLGRIGALYPSKNIPRTHTAAYMGNEKVEMIARVDPNIEARVKFRKLWGSDIKGSLDRFENFIRKMLIK